MERLTKRDSQSWYIDDQSVPYDGRRRGHEVDRLAAYEDTGLTPEEVKDVHTRFVGARMCAQAVIDAGMSPERMGELAEADLEGRVVVLPCKVGDTVYDPQQRFPLEIDHIEITADGVFFAWASYDRSPGEAETMDTGYFSSSDIGKTVFFTREAAEAAATQKPPEREA